MIEVAEHENDHLLKVGSDFPHSLSGKRFDNIVQIDGLNTINFDDYLSEDDDDYHVGDDSGFKFVYPVSFNGTLDLKRDDFYEKKKFVLWRPAADQFKDILSLENNPVWNFSAHHFQVGYDHVKDDYKMIRCTHYSPKIVPSYSMSSGHFWEMYSLGNNSWKKIDVDMSHPCWSRETVYMDDVFHWWDQNETRAYLVSFDFCKESFIKTLIPVDDSFDSKFVRRHLMLLNGFIALILNDTKTSVLHISILGELGVKESWTKLFIVGFIPCLEYPICAGKKENILFRKKDGKLVWFDLRTRMI
ncbi:hypothetical protein QL285_078221 [Trifolium repens]|nr:hypothetical protein QL285_078221 [Trifolium repens]